MTAAAPTAALLSAAAPAPDLFRCALNDAAANRARKFRTNVVRTTKYTLLTFVPKNLFEQFRRIANFYFLCVAILQLIPGISPVSPITSILPLVLVLLATAVKEAYENYKRYVADQYINNLTVAVLDGPGWKMIKWQELAVGQIVRVENGTGFPADLLVLSSSEKSGMLYIETSNLDGETNLKLYQALGSTKHVTQPEQLGKLVGELEYDPPNKQLYKFTGTLELDKKTKVAANTDNVVLRGSTLRNTKFIHGLVVYTGHDTKLMRNMEKTPSKRTRIELALNRQVLLMFAFQVVVCITSAVLSGVWQSSEAPRQWYLIGNDGTNMGQQVQNNAAGSGALSYLTFVILFNVMIPISLYVSLEIVKLFQAAFIALDVNMYHDESDTAASARTSNLNEDLGQIEYVFSDKTGTLTRNLMEFRKCSIGGIWYGDKRNVAPSRVKTHYVLERGVNFTDPSLMTNLMNGHPTAHLITDFLAILAVCHNIVPERVGPENKIVYRAASPDEMALVLTAKMLGFYFHSRSAQGVTVRVMAQDQFFHVLNEVPFTSDRKRMSVVVRDPRGHIRLFCKGADSVMLPRLRPNQAHVHTTKQHLDDFGREGLRTLLVASSTLHPDTYEKWNKRFQVACTAVKNRDEEIAKVAELIETNMDLVGATAIEDKLQAGVPETLANLLEANIKVWVLTGDKQETAINIAKSCNLIQDGFREIILNFDDAETLHKRVKQERSVFREGERAALIIDGGTLLHALAGPLRLEFLELAQKCASVVCCRVSPSQKADVVKLVRKSCNATTLAIGDGANDVSMIQAAHIGVGISGQEGLQAVRAADYAIAQFRFLQRLLFVHGHLSFLRIAKMVMYFFYKNIVMVMTLFWYTLFTAYSGQTLYQSWFISLYNVVFTSLPVIAMGVFDRECDIESLNKFPRLYRYPQRSYGFSHKRLVLWLLEATFHSAAIFFLCYACYLPFVENDGKVADMWSFGLAVYTCVVLVVNLRIALEVRFWNVFVHLAVWLSIVVVFPFAALMSNIYALSQDFFGVANEVFVSPLYWVTIVLVPAIVLLPDFAWKFVEWSFRPKDTFLLRERKRARLPITPDLFASPAASLTPSLGRARASSALSSASPLGAGPPPLAVSRSVLQRSGGGMAFGGASSSVARAALAPLSPAASFSGTLPMILPRDRAGTTAPRALAQAATPAMAVSGAYSNVHRNPLFRPSGTLSPIKAVSLGGNPLHNFQAGVRSPTASLPTRPLLTSTGSGASLLLQQQQQQQP